MSTYPASSRLTQDTCGADISTPKISLISQHTEKVSRVIRYNSWSVARFILLQVGSFNAELCMSVFDWIASSQNSGAIKIGKLRESTRKLVAIDGC